MVDHMFCLKKAWKSGFAEFGHVWLFKKFRRHHSHASGGSIDLQSDGRALSTPKYPTVNERDRACLSQSEARDSCKPEIYHESTLSIYLSDGKFGDNGGDPRSSVLPRMKMQWAKRANPGKSLSNSILAPQVTTTGRAEVSPLVRFHVEIKI